MFKELLPIMRDRAVLLTITLVDDDQIRVNIVPKKLRDGDNEALTTPLSVTGNAEELDSELAPTIVSFVGAHLQMKNTLEKAKAEMDEASKAAQTEARAKSKTAIKSVPPKAEVSPNTQTTKPTEPVKPTVMKPAGLFDDSTQVTALTAAPIEQKEDTDSLAQFAEIDDDDQFEESEELDDVA